MKKEKKQKDTRRRDTHLWRVLRRQWRNIHARKKGYLYLVYFINMLCSGLLPILAVIAPKLIIDIIQSVVTNTQTENLKEIFIIIGIFTGSSLILTIISTITNSIANHQFLALRMMEFNDFNIKLQKVDYQYMEDAKFLDKLDIAGEALGSDYTGFEGVYHHLFDILPPILSVIMYIIILSMFNSLLVVACIVGALVALFISTTTGKYAYKKKDELARARRFVRYYYNTTYNFEYGKDIRIYQLVDKINSDYKVKTYNYISVFKNIKNKEFGLGLLELIMLFIQDGLAYYLIIVNYFNHNITIGDVSLYLASVIALSTTLRTIGVKIGQLNNETRYTDDYYHFMDNTEYETFVTDESIKDLIDDTLEIEFVDVSFKYPNTDRFIFEHLSFKINKGEKLAIVGTNGAGKTTIIKLIIGLFFPTSGAIYVNGKKTTEYDATSYHQMFGVVFQDYHIYAATIIENIIGPDSTQEAREKAIDCLDRVGLTEKIKSLPKGYDTELLKIIHDDGIELSGGQTQKIAIARALYKDANMVILDEPTAALDALTEAEIYQNFDELVKHKTSIYISHRLSSTKFCDHIALFSTDGLIEYGTHEELMSNEKEYYHMFVTQGKYYQEEEGESNE